MRLEREADPAQRHWVPARHSARCRSQPGFPKQDPPARELWPCGLVTLAVLTESQCGLQDLLSHGGLRSPPATGLTGRSCQWSLSQAHFSTDLWASLQPESQDLLLGLA